MKNVRMKKLNRTILMTGLLIAAGIVFSGTGTVRAEEAETELRIADGVYIGSVSVGGMTEAEAKSAMDEYLLGLKGAAFTLKGADGSFQAAAKDLGISMDTEEMVKEALAVTHSGSLISRYKETKDLEGSGLVLDMNLEVDKQAAARLIYAHRGELDVEMVDNGLKRENGRFVFVPGKAGKEVDVVESVYLINDRLKDWNGAESEIELVSKEVSPRGSEEELAKVKDVLGTFSTDFGTSGSNRIKNIKNGCDKINGKIVYPGEEFSVYESMCPFTQENGYEPAGSYLNGRVVDSIGGGICQVSTTLYNAAIRAELDITMRFNHSMIVDYVQPSEDAAIAGTYKDLHFVNNYEVPIYLEGYCQGSVITFNIYGAETRPANRKISFESETVSTTDAETQYTLSADQPAGYYNVDQGAHRGIKARLWKVVTVDGKEQSREIFNNSTYQASPKYVTIGTNGASEEQIAAIQSAIDAKNEDEVKAAAEASAIPEEPEEPETPVTPQTPEEPQTPSVPAVPEEPDEPEQPETPDEPDAQGGSEEPSQGSSGSGGSGVSGE